MNEYSFIFLDLAAGFMRPYASLLAAHDVKYCGEMLDKNVCATECAIDIKIAKNLRRQNDNTNGPEHRANGVRPHNEIV